jgi:P-type E1-E2 ATPase
LIEVEIPGRATLALAHLVLDLNGTVALDGKLLPGLADRLAVLSPRLIVHLATADTHGRAATVAEELGVRLALVHRGQETKEKQALVERLGAASVVAIGNGANDAGMLATAALGIAVLGQEGLAVAALGAGDLVVAHIHDALDLLLHPKRLVATLRR